MRPHLPNDVAQTRLSTHAIVTVGLFALAVLLAAVQPWLWDHLGVFSFLLTASWLQWLWGRADRHFEWVYRTRTRVWAVWRNYPVHWSAQFVLYDVRNTDAFAEARTWLLKNHERPITRDISPDEQLAIINLPVLGVVTIKPTSRAELSTELREPGRPGGVLVVDVVQAGSGYRDAVKLAKRHLFPMLQALHSIADPAKSTYTLKVQFENTNPFWGLFVRHMGRLPLSTLRFELAWSETVASQRRTVTVRQNQLSVAAEDLVSFMELVRTYLAVI